MNRTTFRKAAWIVGLTIVGLWIWVSSFGGASSAGFALGASVVAMIPGRDQVRASLRSAALRYGLNPDWIDVLGYHESRWRLAAVNQTNGDAARGGAWGPTQITETTARAFGYTGEMDQLTTDPDLAADLTCQMVAAQAPATLADLAAFWNAGRRASDPALPASTRAYIARIASELASLPAPPEGVA